MRTTIRALLIPTLLLASACNVAEDGNIPCFDNNGCPSDYPICKTGGAGKQGSCTALGPGETSPTGSVSIAQIEGYPSKDAVVRGTVNVDVVAQAPSGIQSVTLTVNAGSPLSPASVSNGVYVFAVDTTLAAAKTGTLALSAQIVPADGSTAPAAATLTLNYDNQAPTLSVAAFSPLDAKPGSLVTLDLTSSEALGSISGTVSFNGAAVAALARAPIAGTNTYRLTWLIPLDAAAGVYSVTVDATDLAGNADAAGAAIAAQTFTVRVPFTLTSLSLTAPLTSIGGVPAGKLGTAVTAQLKLASSIDTGSNKPQFSLVDSTGHARALSGTPTATTVGNVTTWTIADAITSSDADGTATLTATLVDASSNSATATTALVVDKTAPVASGIAVSKAIVDALDGTETITLFTGEALSAATVTAGGFSGSCDLSAQPKVSCPITLSAPASSTSVTASVKLTDLVGNQTTATTTYTLVPAATGSLVASVATLTAGDSVSLTPTFANGTATINGTPVTSGAPFTTAPTSTTLFTLTVTNPAGHSVTASTTVTVLPLPVISLFNSTASLVGAGDAFQLQFLFSGGTGDVNGTPVTSGTPLALTAPAGVASRTYVLTVKNASSPPADGTATASVTVSFTSLPTASLTFDTANMGSCLTGGSSAAISINPHCDVKLLAIFSGTATILGQSYTTSPQSITVPNVVQTAQYSMDVANAAGDHTSSSVTATVNAVISSFTVSPAFVTQSIATPLTFTASFEGGGVSGSAPGSITPGPISIAAGANKIATGSITSAALGASNFTLTVANSAGTQVQQSASTTVVAPAVALSLLSGSGSIQTGTTTTLTPHFTNDAGGTAVITSGSANGPVVASSLVDLASITVGPAVNTTYFLVVTNRAGQSTNVNTTVNVLAPGSFGAGNFAVTTPANATITGGTSIPTITFSIPQFGGSVTSASLLDNGNNPVLDATGNPISSAAILAAHGGSLAVKTPTTQANDNKKLTYTLTASNAAGNAQVQTQLTVVPAPTTVSLSGTSTITLGQSGALTASNFQNGSGVINPGAIPIVAGQTILVSPASNTSYTLTVTSPAGDAQGTVTSSAFTMTVVQPVALTGALSLNPSIITQGDTAVVATAPAFSASVTTASVQVKDKNGANVGSAQAIASGQPLSLSIGTIGSLNTSGQPYTVVLSAANGATTPDIVVQSVPLTVVGAPGAFSGTAFSASPSTISAGEAGSETFTIPTFGANVTSAAITGNGQSTNVTSSGQAGVTLPKPGATTTYSLTPFNAAGRAGTAVTAVVSVVALPTLTGDLSLSPSSISAGDSSVTATAPTFSGVASASLQIKDKTGTNVGSAQLVSSGQALALPSATISTLTAALSPYTVVLTAQNAAATAATVTQSATLNVFGLAGAFGGSLTVAPPVLTAGESGNLIITTPAWGANVTSATLTGGGLNQTVTNAQVVTIPKPTTSQTFTLTPFNGAGKAGTAITASVSVIAAPVITKFFAATTHATSGDSVGFTIAASGVADGTYPGAIAISGPAGCSGSAPVTLSSGAGTQNVTMPTVTTASTICVFTLSLLNTATTAATATAVEGISIEPLPVITVALAVGVTPIAPGGTASLTYTCTGAGSTPTLNGFAGSCNGSTQTVPFTNVQATTLYTLSITNLAGKTITGTATETVNAVVRTFTVGTSLVASGASINVTANAAPALSLFATYDGAGANGADSNATTLSCSGTGCGTLGSTHINNGGSVAITGLTTAGSSTYTLQVAASGAPGTNASATVTVNVLAAATTTSLTASATTINAGASTTLTATYTTDAAGSAIISDGNGNSWTLPTTGPASIVVAPAASTTYTLTVKNGAGTAAATQTRTITVNPSSTISNFTETSGGNTSNGSLTIASGAAVSFSCAYTLVSGATVSLTGTNGFSASLSGGTCSGAQDTPASSATYTLSVSGGGSGTLSRQVSVLINPTLGGFTLQGGVTSMHIPEAGGATPTASFSFTNGVGVITRNDGNETINLGAATPTINTTHALAPPATAGTFVYTLTVSGSAGTGNAGATALTSTVTVIVDPGSWSTLNNTITSRVGATVTSLGNGKVLITGGCDNDACSTSTGGTGPLATALVCDQTSGSCAAPSGGANPFGGTQMQAARAFARAVYLPGAGTSGQVLITGGYSGALKTGALKSSEIYDLSNNGFITTNFVQSMSDFRGEHTIVALSGGVNAMIFGGFNDQSGGTPVKSGDFYNGSNGHMSGINNMSKNRAQHTATTLSNGTILVVGGELADATTEICTISGGGSNQCTWTAGGAMTESRTQHTATLIGPGVNANRVLICGGLTGPSGSPALTGNCSLSGVTGASFAAVTALSTPRRQLSSLEIPGLSGKVLVCGGYTDTGASNTNSSVCDVEDLSTSGGASSLLTTEPLIHARAAFGMLADGSGVLAAGGDSAPGVNIIELYSPN